MNIAPEHTKLPRFPVPGTETLPGLLTWVTRAGKTQETATRAGTTQTLAFRAETFAGTTRAWATRAGVTRAVVTRT